MALDAFARVIEAWVEHMARVEARVEPRVKLDDEDWRWHIGLDQQSNSILNALYEGSAPPPGAMERIIALFGMRILDDRLVIDRVKGRPIYLALAMAEDGSCRMKPQNLIANLPLAAGS